MVIGFEYNKPTVKCEISDVGDSHNDCFQHDVHIFFEGFTLGFVENLESFTQQHNMLTSRKASENPYITMKDGVLTEDNLEEMLGVFFNQSEQRIMSADFNMQIQEANKQITMLNNAVNHIEEAADSIKEAVDSLRTAEREIMIVGGDPEDNEKLQSLRKIVTGTHQTIRAQQETLDMIFIKFIPSFKYSFKQHVEFYKKPNKKTRLPLYFKINPDSQNNNTLTTLAEEANTDGLLIVRKHGKKVSLLCRQPVDNTVAEKTFNHVIPEKEMKNTKLHECTVNVTYTLNENIITAATEIQGWRELNKQETLLVEQKHAENLEDIIPEILKTINMVEKAQANFMRVRRKTTTL